MYSGQALQYAVAYAMMAKKEGGLWPAWISVTATGTVLSAPTASDLETYSAFAHKKVYPFRKGKSLPFGIYCYFLQRRVHGTPLKRN